MKSFGVVSLCFFLIVGVNARPGQHSNLEGSTANANLFMDKTLENITPWMKKNELDPFYVEAINANFWFEWLFMNHTGEIHLRDGWIHDCSIMTRYGDAYLIYEDNSLTAVANVKLNDLVANFDFSASVLGLSPKGDLIATITDQLAFLRLTFDLRTSKIYLTDFTLDNKGTINIKIHDDGILGLIDGLVNLVVKALQNKFQDQIFAEITEFLQVKIQEKLNDIPPLYPPPKGNSTEAIFNLLNVFQRS